MGHANNFYKHYGIRTDETLAFLSPRVNRDGILVLNLNEVRSIRRH
jgi:hypothetical protein